MQEKQDKRTSAEVAMDLVQGEMQNNIAFAKIANQGTIKEVKEQITAEKRKTMTQRQSNVVRQMTVKQMARTISRFCSLEIS